MAALRAMWAEVQAGRLPAEPTIEWYVHTTVDPSLQDDAGHHSSALFVQSVPYALAARRGTRSCPATSTAAGDLRPVRAGHVRLVADMMPLTPPGIEKHFGNHRRPHPPRRQHGPPSTSACPTSPAGTASTPLRRHPPGRSVIGAASTTPPYILQTWAEDASLTRSSLRPRTTKWRTVGAP
jgi:hypothetical protein